MMYLGGVTLGYFNLYPVGFQPKTGDTRSAGNPSEAEAEAADGQQETLPLEGSRLSSARRPVQWPTHVFF